MQILEPCSEINFSPLRCRYTLEEFWALPEREDHAHYNLIGGYLFIVPPPDPPHGDLCSQMMKSLMGFLIKNHSDGNAYYPPEPIYRAAEGSTYLEPDMFYVSKALRERMGVQNTSADIVIECLCQSTSVYDRTTKADTYLALGVHELWLVDPVTATIEVRNPGKVGEKPVWEGWRYSRGDLAKSVVLDGWEVSVDEIFRGIEFIG